MKTICTSPMNSTCLRALFVLILFGVMTEADVDVFCPSTLVLNVHETGTIACNFTTKHRIRDIRWNKDDIFIISFLEKPVPGYVLITGGALRIKNATTQHTGLYSLVIVALNSSIHFNIPTTNVTVTGKEKLLTTSMWNTKTNGNSISNLTTQETIERSIASHVILWILVPLVIVMVSAILFGGLYHSHRRGQRKRLTRMDSVAVDAAEMTTRLLKSAEPEIVTNTCTNLKMKVYTKLVSQQKIAPWLDPMHLDTYFVNLSLQYRKTGNFNVIDSYNATLKTVSDILKLSGSRTVIYGDAGSGKTTLTLKIIYDWLEGKCLPGVNLLMLLQFRLLDPNCKSFVESILVLCREEVTDEKCAQLENAMENSPESFYMILDGLDEMSSELEDTELSRDIFAILRREKFPSVNLLLTLRKSAHRKLTNISFDNIVNVNGFTKAQTIEFVKQKFFQSKPELGEEAIAYLESRGMMEEVGEVPLLLTFFCALIQQNAQRNQSRTPTTLTGLVRDAYGTYIEHYQGKFPDAKGEEEIHTLTIALGRIAYNGLRGNSKLVWTSKEFCDQISEEQFDVAVKIGIIKIESSMMYLRSAARVTVRDKQRQSVMFPHKLIQEFIAAYFLAHLSVHKRDEEICRISEEVNEMGNVLRFACGINSNAAKSILTALKSSSSDTPMFKIFCLHEFANEHVSLQDNKDEQSVKQQTDPSSLYEQSASLWSDLATISGLIIKKKLETCAVCTMFRLFQQEKSSMRLHLDCVGRGPDCVRELLLDGGDHCLAGLCVGSVGYDAFRSQWLDDVPASNLNHLVIFSLNLHGEDISAILQWCLQRHSITDLIFLDCSVVDCSRIEKKLTLELLQTNSNLLVSSWDNTCRVLDHTQCSWREASKEEKERFNEIWRKFDRIYS